MTQHFENHTNVGPVHPAYLKVVKELDSFLPFWISFVAIADAPQQLYLIQRRLRVVRSAFHYLQRHKTFRPAMQVRKKYLLYKGSCKESEIRLGTNSIRHSSSNPFYFWKLPNRQGRERNNLSHAWNFQKGWKLSNNVTTCKGTARANNWLHQILLANPFHITVTYTRSQQSHTVEKWPHPSFRTTWYRLWNRSPIFTGWYPPKKRQ